MPAIVLVMGKKEGCNKMSKKTHFVTAPVQMTSPDEMGYNKTEVLFVEKGECFP